MLSPCTRWIVACALLVPCSLPLVAQDKPAAAAKDGAAQWKTLIERRDGLIKQVEGLKAKFAEATPEEQTAIRADAQKIAEEFQKEVFPALTELAPQVYKADPQNFEAGELVLEIEYQGNRYDTAVKVGQELIAAGRKTPVTMNITGVSLFAQHEFTKAKALLEEAEKEGQLIPQVGGRYLEECEEYEALWEAEKAIRAREEKAAGEEQLPRVTFKTTRGDVVLELFENEAPNTVANFISLVEAKKYDGIKFHRVIPGFMAQGGDPNTLDGEADNDGQGGPGYTIACECFREDARQHFRGSLSMAHAGKDTGGSQFFLTHLPTPHLNANAEEERGHTVFGRVVKGMDVVAAMQVGDTIETATVTRKRKHAYKPETMTEKRPGGLE